MFYRFFPCLDAAVTSLFCFVEDGSVSVKGSTFSWSLDGGGNETSAGDNDNRSEPHTMMLQNVHLDLQKVSIPSVRITAICSRLTVNSSRLG